MPDNISKLKQLTIQQITAILESGDFDKFIGIEENACLEAKQKHPYDLVGGIKSLAEFSKDIANIANGDNAVYIVFGFVTQKSQFAKTDEIISLDLLNQGEFYTEADVLELVRQGVYPKLELKLKWYPSIKDTTLGLGTLFIEKQSEDKKYFIAKVSEGEGEKLKGFFGIPIRKGSDTTWLPFDEIYAAAKKTPTKPQEMFIQISGQLEEIRGQLDMNGGSKHNPSEELDKKLEEILDE